MPGEAGILIHPCVTTEARACVGEEVVPHAAGHLRTPVRADPRNCGVYIRVFSASVGDVKPQCGNGTKS